MKQYIVLLPEHPPLEMRLEGVSIYSFSFLFAVLHIYQLLGWKIMARLKLQRIILNTTDVSSWNMESCHKVLTFTWGPGKIRGSEEAERLPAAAWTPPSAPPSCSIPPESR